MAHGQGGETIRVRLLWRRYQGRKSPHRIEEASGVFLVLETDNEVVGIA
jgi:hypothetical protein